MDFLDPKKNARHNLLLIVGYVLIGVAIGFATLILLYEAYGFGLGKNGQVIQNGLVYFSSQPNPTKIYLNGKLNSSQTNTRLTLPAGTYQVELTRSGYRSWQRTVVVAGGKVEHFDYPLLFPQKLTTTKLHTYQTAPALATQSLDRRWLLVEQPGSMTSFDVYDLKNPTKAPTVITLPANLLGKAVNPASESWQLVAWADDNDHVVLKHLYDGKTEYVLLDRTNPGQSVNLSQALSGTTFTELTLDNKKYDQYYLYNAANDSLETATLSTPTPTPVLGNVLAYQTYGTNVVLYVTDAGADTGKVNVKELVGNQTYTVRSFPAGTTYLLDLTEYSGVPYVAVGAASDNKVYIYKDPIGQLQANSDQTPVPVHILRLAAPNYLSFSANAQFIVAEGSQQFGVYDIQNVQGYNYTAPLPLDAPQAHATWMDGDRLTYISGGKLVVFDYDHANQQTLMPASSTYLPFFAPNYNYMYSLAPVGGTATMALTRTSLYIPADQ